MTPVDQTRFGCSPGASDDPPGNCWAACIASLLGVSIAEVPDEMEFWKPGMHPRDSWRPYEKRMHRWLLERGVVLVEFDLGKAMYCGPNDCIDGMHYILSGPSPRNPDVLHAVVGRGSPARIEHDPHHSRDGLKGDPQKWTFEFLIKACNA